MGITIRRIRESDCGQAAVIWRDVLDIVNATPESVAEIYREMEKNSDYRTYVAEADGKVVGLAAAVKVLAVGHPGGYIKMNGIGVLPEYRRRGIARELLRRVIAEARAYGCGTVQITASDMGVLLYTDFGFVKNGNFMQYKL